MRRWLTRILICLILGAVTTLAVAWGIVAWSPSLTQNSGARQIDSRGDTWSGARQAGFGITEFTLFGVPEISEPGFAEAERFPRWVEVPQDRPLDERVVFVLKTGWPLRAITCWRDGVGVRDPVGGVAPTGAGPQHIFWGDWHRALVLVDGSVVIARVLPWGVRPGAFAVNALVFALPWILVLVLSDLRRWRRTRRGLCPMCKYDLRGDLDAGCPECGWNRSDDQPSGEAGG